ncbi:hypothetical protein [Streptococcus moroccensis]|uniref:V/A-type H+-transporting ATPase subunit E n=1 Tax=Streptococcus moroccensis TaxID=1451356 RepID=A0ABT9YVE4_9STRE|nr:hypothetical protein [Streptococcus moroccensis]MDQ0223293.1 V/A-type H+-transporting ATPase subunit E [Streptococcus moroccensis]
MSDMTGLKASVLEQSHEKGRLNLAAAKEKIQADFEKKKEHLIFEKESVRKQRLGDIARRKQRDVQQLENQARQSSLVTKQEVLKELFTAAQTKMADWPEASQVSFFGTLVAGYNTPVTVQVGQLTADKFSETTWQELASKYPQVTFASERVLGEAGFLFSDGKVDDNYLYSTLVDEIWESESYRLASEIFQAE